MRRVHSGENDGSPRGRMREPGPSVCIRSDSDPDRSCWMRLPEPERREVDEEVDGWERYNLNVVAVRQPDGSWDHATGETILSWGDTVIIMGPAEVAEHFIDLA